MKNDPENQTQANDIERLTKEVQYYRKHVDELAGEILKLEYTAYGLRQEAKQKDRSLALLKQLQQSIGPQQERSAMIEIALPAICSIAAMDKSGFVEFRDSGQSQWTTYSKESGLSSSLIPFLNTQNQNAYLVNRSTEKTPEIEQLQQQFDLPFFVSVPLILDGLSVGFLICGRMREIRPTQPALNDGDVLTLQAVADLISATIQNRRIALLEATLQEQASKIKLAAQIQLELLPKAFPRVEGYDIAGTTISAETVGGDYFDFIQVDEKRLALCVGDVSGKGLPASLLMANLQATIRGQTLWSPSGCDCLERSNKLLFRSTDIRKYATLFYGILNTKSNWLSYSNAGHNPPMLLSSDEAVTRLRSGGPVLGVFENATFQEEVIPFNAGDLLILFSDGVSEAMNVVDEEFGEQRLLNTIFQNRGASASELISKILADVSKHVGSHRQMDDMTLVVVRRTN